VDENSDWFFRISKYSSICVVIDFNLSLDLNFFFVEKSVGVDTSKSFEEGVVALFGNGFSLIDMESFNVSLFIETQGFSME
jgi:hypothetical protein